MLKLMKRSSAGQARRKTVVRLRINQRWHSKRWLRVITYAGLGVLLINVAIGIYGYRLQREQPYEFGTSFSLKMARELGIEPRAALESLLKDVGIRHLRLMSYWDEHQTHPETYDFSELDWQFDLADQYGAKVSLAIGLRQPRWPECHEPEWAKTLPYDAWRQAIKDYMAVVINRYRDRPSLETYQLENEFFIATFGTCTDYNRDRFVDEFNLVKHLDPSHTIVINLSNNWYGWPVRAPQPEQYFGISIYKKVWDDRVTNGYFEYPLPGWYYAHRAGWIKLFTGKQLVAHEFQAEPWGPVPTVQLTSEEQDITMNAATFLERIDYIEQTGIKRVYLWGGEWWYWRLTKFNDPEMWQAVSTVVDSHARSQPQ